MLDASATLCDGKLTVCLPVVTASESNERRWQRTMHRKISAKRAVREAIGPHHGLFTPFAEAYHSGEAIAVSFCRVGQRRCDHSNLPAAMKYVEDQIAAFIAADDGDPRWRPTFSQDADHERIGVVVEMRIFG